MKYILALALFVSSFSLIGQSGLEVENDTESSKYSIHGYLSGGLWNSYQNNDYVYKFEDGVKFTLGGKVFFNSPWFVDANIGIVMIGEPFFASSITDIGRPYIVLEEPSGGIVPYTYNLFLAERMMTFNLSGGYRFRIVEKLNLDLGLGLDYNVLSGSEFESLDIANTASDARSFRSIGLQFSAALTVDIGALEVGFFGKYYFADWERNDHFSPIMPDSFFEYGVMVGF